MVTEHNTPIVELFQMVQILIFTFLGLLLLLLFCLFVCLFVCWFILFIYLFIFNVCECSIVFVFLAHGYSWKCQRKIWRRECGCQKQECHCTKECDRCEKRKCTSSMKFTFTVSDNIIIFKKKDVCHFFILIHLLLVMICSKIGNSVASPSPSLSALMDPNISPHSTSSTTLGGGEYNLYISSTSFHFISFHFFFSLSIMT
jgi:hypothetical protein